MLKCPTNLVGLFAYICLMEIQKITIAGVDYPMAANMNSVYAITKENDLNDLEAVRDLANSLDLLKSIEFSRSCAFHLIQAGYRVQKQASPFEQAYDLGDVVESWNELAPATKLFFEAFKGFFTAAPEQKGA